LAVHLVEREFPGAGTSRAGNGLILQWPKEPGPLLELARQSAALWAELSERLGESFDYRRNGCLVVAQSEGEWEAVQKRATLLAEWGIWGQQVEGRELTTWEPHLAPDLAGGIFFPGEAQLDPRKATWALLRAAQRRGLKVHFATAVRGFERGRDGSLRGVRTAQGCLATRRVLLAAGVWSGEIAALAGVQLPICPRKGQVIVTERAPGFLSCPLLEAGYGQFPAERGQLQVALVAEPTAGGNLLIGSSREFVGFDRRVSLRVLQAVAARARRFLPSLAKLQILRSYAGLRPFSPDGRPLIGPVPEVPGLYVATGHEGSGICLAPITGRLLAQWVTKQPLSVAPEPFDPARTSLAGE